MSTLPLHPVVVHVPMALAVLVPLAAAGVLVAWWRGWLPGRAWALVLALQLALVVGGFVALTTGESDEERVERVVAEAAIESHESAAKRFQAAAAGVLGLMLVPLLVRREGTRRRAALVATAGTLGVAALGVDVGHRGGQLVYEHGAAQAYAPGQPPAAALAGHDDD